ncbi:PLD nuclease N-terminal domain-containing protein [Arthrobacter sp. I2-34]|uniref:PLD nuclease N-terminal domain-containing protein n=1 Tax=Arthrobacter hankyongi TaxID=2904801 RepID=A0ABS9LAJ6_9MICC|nr:PLD nuclease N-terminal domain-containing protein [Arthrobacter hankyongi]MCG2623497.1 PLD nuclease N-terminal domain-containing protein [Arthrobacter hankyongi]
MARLYILLVVLAVSVIVYALIECIRSAPSEVRSIPKAGWILAILFVPLIGAGLWFLFGRPRPGGPVPQGPRSGPLAPDEDTAFLRSLDAQRRQQLREEELRRREQELRDRDKSLGEEEQDNNDGSTR